MKTFQQNQTNIIVWCIVIAGFVLRFYHLSENPPSLNWDEASLGYNAYSILKTGADEYGTPFPISIRSFDDYKPALYSYLTVPFVGLFGLNPFAVRFISAFLGGLTVIVVYMLVREIYGDRVNRVDKGDWVAMVAAGMVAISPWHLQFSRSAYEGNIGLFFFLLALYLFLVAVRTGKGFVLAGLLFAVTIYSYHSFRLVVPVFLAVLSGIYVNNILSYKTKYVIMVTIVVIAAVPIIMSFFSSAGTGSRLSMVTIFSGHDVLAPSIERTEYDRMHDIPFASLIHNRRVVYFLSAVKGYLDHFDPRFLFIHGDGGRHHHAVDVGMLYLTDLIFLIIGVIVSSISINRNRAVLYILLLVAPLASAITTGTPHPVRAIAMAPVLHIFTAVGIVYVVKQLIRLRSLMNVSILTLIIFFYAGNILYYIHQYYVHTPIEYGDFWQAGHKELFNELKEMEESYDHIIVTYQYDQPYIFYLFYNQIDPAWYQENWDYAGTGEIDRMYRKIGKYEFMPIDWNQIKHMPDTLVAGSPSEIPDSAAVIDTIQFPNGETAFVIAKT